VSVIWALSLWVTRTEQLGDGRVERLGVAGVLRPSLGRDGGSRAPATQRRDRALPVV